MIRNHMLRDAKNSPSPNYSRGTITPKFLVMHYTASWTVGSVLRTFSSRNSKVSAHLTIDLDGTVYQHVPFNVRAWHAGSSRHAGYSDINSHSIGIEFVNPGFLRKATNGYVDHTGQVVRNTPPLVEFAHPRVGSGMHYWPIYSQEQLASGLRVSKELIDFYQLIDVVSHEEIDTRGWKTDPGPAFPMNKFKSLLHHRDITHERYQVTASSLNIRHGPSTAFNIVSKLRRGDIVQEVGRSGEWVQINSDGWVHGGFLRRI